MEIVDVRNRPDHPSLYYMDEFDVRMLRKGTTHLDYGLAWAVCRSGALHPRRPGYVIIPNVGSMIGSAPAVKRFHVRLMRALLVRLRVDFPAYLAPQNFAPDDPPPAARQRRGVRLDHVDVPGLGTLNKPPHLDVSDQLVASLRYGRRAQVRGGEPQFTDLLALAAAEGKSVADLLEVRLASKTGAVRADGSWPLRYARVAPGWRRKAREFTTRFVGLEDDQAIVVFTNRLEDGLLHGASPAKATGPRACRRVDYIGLGRR